MLLDIFAIDDDIMRAGVDGTRRHVNIRYAMLRHAAAMIRAPTRCLAIRDDTRWRETFVMRQRVLIADD